MHLLTGDPIVFKIEVNEDIQRNMATRIEGGMELKTEGGMAGRFIVVCKSSERVIEPLIEGIMTGTGTGMLETLVFNDRVIEDNT